MAGIYVVPEPGQLNLPSRSSFKNCLEYFEQEHKDKLDSADRKHLNRWAVWTAERLWQEPWTTIQTKATEHGQPFAAYASPQFFIRYFLQVRRVAESINQARTAGRRRLRDLKQAEQAENLAKLLRGIGTQALPDPLDLQLSKLLDFRARRWRDPGELWMGFGPMRISRVDLKGSRPRVAFMNAMSRYMAYVCRQPLDNVVAMLSDIAFLADLRRLKRLDQHANRQRGLPAQSTKKVGDQPDFPLVD
jgi:hypothetical protein